MMNVNTRVLTRLMQNEVNKNRASCMRTVCPSIELFLYNS